MNLTSFSQALGWSLIHSLWQGLAIGLIVFAATRNTSSAERRHNLHCLGLLALMISFGGTFVSKIQTTGSPKAALSAQPAPSPAASFNVAIIQQNQATSSFKQTINWERVVANATWFWFAGVALMTLRAAAAGWRVRSLSKNSTPISEEAWLSKLEDWSNQFGITKAIGLATTALIDTPAVIGHFKPLILIPAAILTRLNPSQVEALVIHELAHIRRHDFLINALQIAAETLLFFHPVAWWLSRSIRHERELCCDQVVAARFTSPADYVRALVSLEELRVHSPELFAMAASGGSLKLRVERLLKPQSSIRSGFSVAFVALLLLVGVILCAWPKTQAQPKATDSFFEVRALSTDTNSGGTPARGRFDGALPIYLTKEVIINNSHVKSVEVEESPSSKRPEIIVQLNPDGAARFAKAAREYLGKQLAIVVDGQVVSVPMINSEIPSGRLSIAGSYSLAEAIDLAKKLDPNARVPVIPPGETNSIRFEAHAFELSGTDAYTRDIIAKHGTDANWVNRIVPEKTARNMVAEFEKSTARKLGSPVLTTTNGQSIRMEIGSVPGANGFSPNARGYVTVKNATLETNLALIGLSLDLRPEVSGKQALISGHFKQRELLERDVIQTNYSFPFVLGVLAGDSFYTIQKSRVGEDKYVILIVTPEFPE